ncbi:unnamed protein product, partial [Symbiodinium sp. KB8]
ETRERTEPVLATATSRWRYWVGHLGVAVGGALVVLLLSGLVLGISSAAVMGDGSLFGDGVTAVLAYFPAVLVMAGVPALTVGLFPKFSAVAWAMLMLTFVVSFFGTLLELPDWVLAVSPFDHIALVPVETMSVASVTGLCLVAAALLGVGLATYQRRDIPAPVVEQLVPPAVDHASVDTGGPVRASLVWATWALFVGLGVMVAGAGLYATTVGIRAEAESFPTVAIGAMSAGYYLGFLVGSRAALYVLTTVGHIRVYTALAALLTVTILVTGMVVHPAAWIALRMLAGACLAGQYVVAESWLNQIVTNDQRARVLGFYTLVTVVPYGVGQLGVGVIDPATLTIFAVAAILISLAVTPVSLSAAAAPPLHLSNEKMTLRELFALVPTGVVTSLLVGIAHGAFIGLGAVYGARVGLSAAEVGIFVTMPTLGSLLLQIPIA